MIVHDRPHLTPGAESSGDTAERLAALHQQAGVLAHDFNNLMGVILGVTEKLAADLTPGAAEQKLAVVAMEAAERGAELLGRLLDVARRSKPAEPVDCAQVIERTLRFLHHTTPRDVEIWASSPPQPLRCLADAAGLEAALMNLCLNASHAMPDGGLLRIDARDEALDGAAAARLGLAPGAYVSLTVRDTGCGMSEETLARAAEPLFTTRKDAGGTGLGLSSVHDFANGAGGVLALASREREGTAATLYLPRQAADPQGSEQPRAA